MKCSFLILVLSFIATTLFAQLDTAYIHTFGGELDEQGRDIELTSDNGFIMVGATSSFGHGNSDIYLVKVDSNLDFQWSQAIGHYHLEFGHAVKQTQDGGYILCGYSNSTGNGTYDGYLVKTDDTGGVVWEKFYGGFDWDKLYDLEITPDGGFMLVGETHSQGSGDADAWVLKTDSLGNVEWEKTFGGSKKDIAHALISTRDGNYAFCGENASKHPKNKGDAWLVKFDGQGDVVFDVEYSDNTNQIAYGLLEDDQGNFVIVGSMIKNDSTDIDELMVRFDKQGKFKDGVGVLYGPNTDLFHDVIQENGTYFTAGSSNSFGNGAYKKTSGIRSISLSGITPIYGPVIGEGSKNEFGYKIVNRSKDRFIVGASAYSNSLYSDLCVVEYKSDSVAVNYKVEYSIGKNDTGKIQLKPNSLTTSYTDEESLSVFPNPCTNYVIYKSTIEISIVKVYNISGIVVSIQDNVGNSSVDLSHLNQGVYFLEFHSPAQKIMVRKIAKN